MRSAMSLLFPHRQGGFCRKEVGPVEDVTGIPMKSI